MYVGEMHLQEHILANKTVIAYYMYMYIVYTHLHVHVHIKFVLAHYRQSYMASIIEHTCT